MSVEELKKELPNEDSLYDLAELFKVFGDSTRIRILSCLKVSELCVNDISEALNMTLSAVSHQLRILKNAKLIKARKQGKEVYYSFDDDHISTIFKYGLEHICEDKYL